MNISKLKAGDVIFARNNKWLSRTIRWVTKSDWSHVAVYLGEGQVIDTDAFRNVSIHKLSDFETWDARRCDKLTDDKLKGVISYLVKRMNAPYDYLQIAGFFLEAVFGLKNSWQMRGKYTCGSLIDTAFVYNGIDFVTRSITGDVTPEDLLGSSLLHKII